MKVICKKNTAKGLDLNEVTNLFLNEYEYGIDLHKEYLVMGLAIYKDTNCLYYLIDDDGLPNWYPYMLFEISDDKLPANWHIQVCSKDSSGDIFTLIGFYELCKNEDFYDLLMEREEQAMRTYFRRKIELEKEYESNL